MSIERQSGVAVRYQLTAMNKAPALTDSELRPALRSWVAASLDGNPDTLILEELGICRGQARVDLVVVNGMLQGYEIKSDRDSLRRLAGQVECYSRVLDRVTLVVGERHLREAQEMVPRWWGILRVRTNGPSPRFTTVRKGGKNPGPDPRSLVELLWRDDAVAFLEQRGAARGIRSKPRSAAWDRICEQFGVDEIAVAVRAQLKARTAQPVPSPPS